MKNTQKTSTVMPLSDNFGATVQADSPVVVIDSGIGGICVLRALRRLLPREELLYFGDSANAPYGGRPPEEVRALVLGHAARLLEQGKALVVACNTATSLCIGELRRRYPATPIVGMEPALKPALAVGAHPRILVLATPITLREGKFAALLQKYAKAADVCAVSAPGIVDFVERGVCDGPALEAYLAALLAPYRSPAPDALVLGCTHFPFVKSAILRALGREMPVFDGVEGTASEVVRRLCAAGLENKTPTRGAVRLTSSAAGVLPLYARLLFGEEGVESGR